ncbi:unnamed protein product [Choristocarpus tenellus]
MAMSLTFCTPFLFIFFVMVSLCCYAIIYSPIPLIGPVDNVVLPTTDDSIGSDYGEEEESVEGGTKPSQKEDEDLKAIAEDMQRLKTFLAKIETKQLHERMRLAVQETMAKENQEGMVRSSVIETVVLLLVSCGQIFFVRRWFQGKGTLLKHWSS